jgi:hypothetical protein
MQFEINDARVKSLAWSMKNALSDKGHDVPSTAILEALSQGLGFSDYRTLKAMSEEPSEFVKRAREWMKGDAEVAVYFQTYYDTMLMAPDYPDWGKLVLTENALANIFELHAKVENEKLSEIASANFGLHWKNQENYRLDFPQLIVDSSSVFLKVCLRHEDGAVQTRPWYFDDLHAAIKTRKAGEAVFVELEDTKEVESSDPDSPEYARYLVAGSWGHCFVGSKEPMVSFVFDRKVKHITYMLVGDELAHRDEMADVEDSLLNANEEALDDPKGWGLEEMDQLPPWATGEPAQKVKPSVREAVIKGEVAEVQESRSEELRRKLRQLGYEVFDVSEWVFETFGMDMESVVDEQVDAWIAQFLDLKG